VAGSIEKEISILKHHVAYILTKIFSFPGRLRRNAFAQKNVGDEMPLRSELFSSSQMEEHGRTLAELHILGEDHTAERLLTRLAKNEDILFEVRDLLTDAVRANRRIIPAGEWLLDNFYLIEEQILAAKNLLPKGYARRLPRLKDGPSKGLPRVYDIALETISHGDGRLDSESLCRFVAAYQTITTLQLGELWAIPIMLRLALIENLRRVAARIAIDRINRNLADYWADKISETAETDPKRLILTIADMARSNPPMVSPFVAELARRLQGQGSALALPLAWIEQQLSESYLTIEQLVQSENQQQAADQLSISNSIGSLRFLNDMNWRKFVETMSAVEQVLQEDPAGIYEKMDFSTRDQYRHIVEEVAKKSRFSEKEVALEAIKLARQNNSLKNDGKRATHVGFYLIDKGLPKLERHVGVKSTALDMLRRTGSRFPLLFYLGSIFFFTAIFSAGLPAKIRPAGWPTPLVRGDCRSSVGKPACHSYGQFFCDTSCQTASFAANGFFQRNST
jgi:cyclic beta-1,2-glucan synthetase